MQEKRKIKGKHDHVTKSFWDANAIKRLKKENLTEHVLRSEKNHLIIKSIWEQLVTI